MNKIALLNDAFRRTFRGGKVMMTSGVDELPDCVKAEALRQVATFSEFTADNDPHDARFRELHPRGAQVLLENRLLR
jgi:hypothetical protein